MSSRDSDSKREDNPRRVLNTNGYFSLHGVLEKEGPDGDGEVHRATVNRAEIQAVIAALEFRVWWGEGWSASSSPRTRSISSAARRAGCGRGRRGTGARPGAR